MTKANPKALISVDKFLSFVSMQEGGDWHEYCDNGALNLMLIAAECDISRSTFYCNEHIKKEVMKVALALLDNGVIDRLPYEKEEKTPDQAAPRRDRTNKEMAKLQEENRRLQNKVSELKSELDDKKKKLSRFEAMEDILGKTGRMPR